MAFCSASSIAVPPIGFEAFDISLRLGDIFLIRRLERFKEIIRLGGEADDVKAVLLVQIRQAERQRLLGLLHLLASHRAGGIQHEADVLGLHLRSLISMPGEASSRK